MINKKFSEHKIFLMTTIIFAVSILFLSNNQMIKAATYRYGDFAVTELSSTSVAIDYRNLYYETVNGGASVLGYQIYLQDYTSGNGERFVTSATANQVYGTVSGLTPGHEYSVKVSLRYQYPGTASDEIYYYIMFNTPSSGTSSYIDAVSDTPVNPYQPEPTAAPQLEAPSIDTVKMVGNDVGIIAGYVDCDGYEYNIYRYKSNTLAGSDSSLSNSTTFYGMSRKSVYYVTARTYAYDSNGDKIYSEWGNRKYFVPQPKMKNKALKVRQNSIYLKWGKVAGADKYTIYMRKRSTGKWSRVKTVKGKKSSCTITKYKGKGFNTHNTDYEVKIKASAKIGGNVYHSTTNNYIYTYIRYR